MGGLIDVIPILIIFGIAVGLAVLMVIHSCGPFQGAMNPYTGLYRYNKVCGRMNASGETAIVIGLLVALAYSIWNWGYRLGTTGATIGKSVLKFKVLGKETDQPVGFDAKRSTKVAALALLALLPLSWLAIEAATHLAGPDYL